MSITLYDPVFSMRLGRTQIRNQLAGTGGWRLRGKRVSRLFVFEDFAGGIKFLNRVAKLAESMNHHPDIDIRYNRIKLSLTTHDEGGLTMKDFKLARKINKLVGARS
jgi:4a-hydroxytetrahydrobiopterin dehydratase